MINLRWLVIPILVALFCTISCSSVHKEQKHKTIDNVMSGILDPVMKKRWEDAESKGDLPPLHVIPTPEVRVAQRKPTIIKEPQIEKRRPIIPKETIADVQMFSKKPIESYKGSFRITKHQPGVLSGMLEQQEEEFELLYKIPAERNMISVSPGAMLQLKLMDRVEDSALQRNVILYTDNGTAPLVYIAEGSYKPLYKRFDELNLIIEQEKGEGNPLVKVTFAGDTLTLKQNERKKLGAGKKAVYVHLLESIAVNTSKAMLQEGQPFYVSILLFRPE